MAGIIFRIISFTIVFFDPENNVLFSGSKTGVIPKICRQREVSLVKKADLQLSKKETYSSVEIGSSHEYITKLN